MLSVRLIKGSQLLIRSPKTSWSTAVTLWEGVDVVGECRCTLEQESLGGSRGAGMGRGGSVVGLKLWNDTGWGRGKAEEVL